MALVLHILCGFSVSEIASAFVSSHAAIEKRITRAKKVLATSKTRFDLAAASEFSARLPPVQRALYLLFNESYYGASAETAVRVELCREAMRLTALLLGTLAWEDACDPRARCPYMFRCSTPAGARRCSGQPMFFV